MMLRNMEQRDISYCVDMYLSMEDKTFMPADREASLHSLKQLLSRRKFVKVFELDSKIAGWIYADVVRIPHLLLPNFQQLYFCSEGSGIKVYKTIRALHSEMLLYSEKLNVGYCVSPGSHLDEKNTFVRCLQREGWDVRHYIACHPAPRKFAPAGCQVWRR